MQVEDSSGSASRDNAHPGQGGVQGDMDDDGVADGDGVVMDSDMHDSGDGNCGDGNGGSNDKDNDRDHSGDDSGNIRGNSDDGDMLEALEALGLDKQQCQWVIGSVDGDDEDMLDRIRQRHLRLYGKRGKVVKRHIIEMYSPPRVNSMIER